MSKGKPHSRLGRLGSRSLLAAAALLASLVVLAPSASAELKFEPGTFAKSHDPITTQTLAHEVSPFLCPVPYQCVLGGFVDLVTPYVQEIKDAPEIVQAGGHPDFSVHFRFQAPHAESPAGHPKTIVTDAPAGAIGSPLAVPRCEAADFNLTVTGACPKESMVGEAVTDASGTPFYGPMSSLVPYPGVSALVGFKVITSSVILKPEIRSDSDYGLRFTVDEVPIPLLDYAGSTLTFWGVPHDPIHDRHRVNDVGIWGTAGSRVEGTPRPLLSAPTNCSTGEIGLTVKARSWEEPGVWKEETDIAPEPTGCEEIDFEPSLSAKPTTNFADSPTGLEVDLHTPQNEDCEFIPESEAEEEELLAEGESLYDCGLATSHLKDTTVTLPEGLALNPSGANGLDGCSTQEIGLTTPLGVSPQQFSKEQPDCPDASRIGGVEVDTPLLDAPMPGSVYLADPYDNPFESLTAIYIVANDEERGIVVKLAGNVEPDPITGQLKTTFENAPQLPFEHFLLHFKQGPHAALRTPAKCGEYTSTSTLTPYADPDTPVNRQDSFSITQGGCDRPNAPDFDAGTVSPIAKNYSPFVMHLRRDDGSQKFKAITISPPQGTIAKLAGVAQCSGADLAAAAAKSGKQEEASPSCPAASEVGNAVAGAGAGPSPYYAPGKAYMSGPYKGAPLSIAIITPATAGPFDLGTIVIRTALYVDPVTAQITAVSDPIPEILEGIPLDVRTVDLSLDRPEFTQTGTSCDPDSVDGQLTSTLGQVANLSSRFQLAECTSLGFKPRMFIKLKGGTRRGSHPQLVVVLKPRPGDANIARLQLAMPRSEFLDQAHIRTVCTRVQFAADKCPRGAVYGRAVVRTPILDEPLTGRVYLRSSNNTLPDVVPDLRGPAYLPLKVESAGRTDSIRGGIRNTFSFIPDAPFSKLVTRLQGGKKGLLINSRDICARTYRATVKYVAHNGKTLIAHPKVHAGCKGKRKVRKNRRHHRPALAQRSAVR